MSRACRDGFQRAAPIYANQRAAKCFFNPAQQAW